MNLVGYKIVLFYLIIGQLLCTKEITLIKIYCSKEFVLKEAINVICAWISGNNSLHSDTYDEALNDCPNGYVLDDLVRLDKTNYSGLIVASFCDQNQITMWKKLHKGCNSLTIYRNSSIETKPSNSKTNSYFICTRNESNCNCSLRQFCNNSICQEKYSNGVICSSNNQCQNYSGLLCINGTCQCSIKDYWNNNTFELKCLPKKNLNENCTSNKACIDELLCVNETCQCSQNNNHYFDYTSLKCVSKTLHNTLCLTNNTCRTDLGLSCQNGTCQCLESQFWHSSKERCFNPLTYGDYDCFSIEDCFTSLNLICNDNSINNSCNCPKTSMTGMCDCPFDNYWNGNQCIPRSIEYQQCNSSIPFSCISGLTCDSCSSTCINSSSCALGWFPFNGKCYKILKNVINKNISSHCVSAFANCKQAIIDSVQLHNYLTCKLNIPNYTFANISIFAAISCPSLSPGKCYYLSGSSCGIDNCNCGALHNIMCEYIV